MPPDSTTSQSSDLDSTSDPICSVIRSPTGHSSEVDTTSDGTITPEQ
ncbi:hypothetical protein PF003_g16166 [Phytophthora fragariae]|nr:hypothetical protein PF003_g16166 [Phytophthora fragariae]